MRFSKAIFAAVVLAPLMAGTCSGQDEQSLVQDQGWDQDRRDQFYFTPQGSRMMPNAWFRALETLNGEGRFASPENLARYGLLPPDRESPLNPDGYPIGFAVDPDGGADGASQAVGLTCAACHTSTVEVEGQPMRIDGGPSNFDFDSFFQDLSGVVKATLLDDGKFARFAGAVLGAEAAEKGPDLKARLAVFQVTLAGEAALRRPSLASGFGRVDALTQIVNSLAVRDQMEVANLTPVDAPTSYPPLWLAPQLEFVQWSPIAASPIGRNSGEVLGVFGRADLTGASGDPFSSTVLLDQLHAMENWISELTPPVWIEEVMGPIDRDLAAEGQALFSKNCAGCHNMAPFKRTDPAENFFGKDFIKIGKINYRKVGTDPAYIESLSQRLIRTNAVTAGTVNGAPVVPAATFFLTTVGTVIGKAMNDAGLDDGAKAALNGFRFTRGEDGAPVPYRPTSVTDMKASPLTGAWATGPYLHNGSVPTIYEVLSPPDERRTVFWTGGRELDREKLGFLSDDAPGRFRYDTSLPGNGNMGHEFPKGGLSPEERLAIIEFLKTQ